jgi:hypothetical protein
VDFVIIIIVVLLAIGIWVAATSRRRRPPAVKPGPSKAGLFSPPPPPEAPTEPGFIIHKPADPGFKVVNFTGILGAQPSQRPKNARATSAGANGFDFIEVTQNLTAICKLTGKKAGECTCDLHKNIQQKGTK